MFWFNDLTWICLIMFLGLNRLKSDDLGSKRCNLGFKWSRKGQKDPWEDCCRASRRPGLTDRRAPNAMSLISSWGPIWQDFSKMGITFNTEVWFYQGWWIWKDNSIIYLWVGHERPNSFFDKSDDHFKLTQLHFPSTGCKFSTYGQNYGP